MKRNASQLQIHICNNDADLPLWVYLVSRLYLLSAHLFSTVSAHWHF